MIAIIARFVVFTLVALLFRVAAHANELIANGSFDNADNPLNGWIVDFAWMNNRHYRENASRVTVVDREDGQRRVAKLTSPGDGGVKLETAPIPFEQNARYRATFKVKGGPYRVYFSGYQWKPGVRPNETPTLEQMRQSFRGKAEAGSSSGWQTFTIDLPGVQASDLSLEHLRRVRFITLYFWFSGNGFVDDVAISKVGSR